MLGQPAILRRLVAGVSSQASRRGRLVAGVSSRASRRGRLVATGREERDRQEDEGIPGDPVDASCGTRRWPEPAARFRPIGRRHQGRDAGRDRRSGPAGHEFLVRSREDASRHVPEHVHCLDDRRQPQHADDPARRGALHRVGSPAARAWGRWTGSRHLRRVDHTVRANRTDTADWPLGRFRGGDARIRRSGGSAVAHHRCGDRDL